MPTLAWEELSELDRECYRVAAVTVYEEGYDAGYNDAYDRK